VPNRAPALLIRTSMGGSRLAISAATRFISAKRVRSAKYAEWAIPGPRLWSRAKVKSFSAGENLPRRRRCGTELV
jgi:hypothetical protein